MRPLILTVGLYFILIGLVLLTGCASTGQDYRGALDSDVAACELDGEKSRTAGGYGGLLGIATYNESYNRVFDACMRARGYAKTAVK